MPAQRRFNFRRESRLRGRGKFKSIRDSSPKVSRGPLLMWAVLNGSETSRLGISIGRQVGNAARRNRIKRLLRESFRQAQHDPPCGFDFVIVVRPHAPLALAEYQKLLGAMIVRVVSASNSAPSPEPQNESTS